MTPVDVLKETSPILICLHPTLHVFHFTKFLLAVCTLPLCAEDKHTASAMHCQSDSSWEVRRSLRGRERERESEREREGGHVKRKKQGAHFG